MQTVLNYTDSLGGIRITGSGAQSGVPLAGGQPVNPQQPQPPNPETGGAVRDRNAQRAESERPQRAARGSWRSEPRAAGAALNTGGLGGGGNSGGTVIPYRVVNLIRIPSSQQQAGHPGSRWLRSDV